jgi:hypothetical protein
VIFILGVGKVILSKVKFRTLKSDTTLTVPFLFGMTNEGDQYADTILVFKTPNVHRRWISFFRVYSFISETGNGSNLLKCFLSSEWILRTTMIKVEAPK